jgi:hypothetical protein
VYSGERFTLQDVLYLAHGEYKQLSDLGMDSEVEFRGEVVGTVKEVFEWIFLEKIIPQAQVYVKDNFKEIFKTYANLRKIMYIEKEENLSVLYVISGEGNKTEISKVKFIFHGTRWVADVKPKHSLFNEKMISTGKYIDTDGSLLKFIILQDPDSKQIHVNWRKKPKGG